MKILTSEEQTWKNGPVQLCTMVESGDHRLKHTVEMSRKLEGATEKTSDLVDKEVVCEVNEITTMSGRIQFRGDFKLAKPNNAPATK